MKNLFSFIKQLVPLAVILLALQFGASVPQVAPLACAGCVFLFWALNQATKETASLRLAHELTLERVKTAERQFRFTWSELKIDPETEQAIRHVYGKDST